MENNSGDLIWLIITGVVIYICLGVSIGYKYVSSNNIVGIHEDEIIAAFALFWPIVYACLIIMGLLLLVINASKGLYYLVIERFKED